MFGPAPVNRFPVFFHMGRGRYPNRLVWTLPSARADTFSPEGGAKAY